MGGTFAKIIINNNQIGHVITRHSLNYVILENNIKIFDIKKYLKIGDNLIIIENSIIAIPQLGINVCIFFNNQRNAIEIGRINLHESSIISVRFSL